MVPAWLNALAVASLIVAALCAALVVIDLVRFPQPMAIMNWVWPITALYGGPLAVWVYVRSAGRLSRERSRSGGVTVGVTHCGAGCTLGDIIAEVAHLPDGLHDRGSMLGTEYIGDYAWRTSSASSFNTSRSRRCAVSRSPTACGPRSRPTRCR